MHGIHGIVAAVADMTLSTKQCLLVLDPEADLPQHASPSISPCPNLDGVGSFVHFRDNIRIFSKKLQKGHLNFSRHHINDVVMHNNHSKTALRRGLRDDCRTILIISLR